MNFSISKTDIRSDCRKSLFKIIQGEPPARVRPLFNRKPVENSPTPALYERKKGFVL